MPDLVSKLCINPLSVYCTLPISSRETALHILINNSGTNWGESIDTYPPDAFDSVMQLNVRSVFDLTQKFIPMLTTGSAAGNPARVINISSIDSITFPALETYAYSASKAAVTHLSRVMGGKLARRGAGGITVNAILPGAFYSRMMRATIDGAGEFLTKSIPLQRIGDVADIAGACLFLCGKSGAWVTGTSFAVDGGASVASTFAPEPKL
jgi:NAD(P)-dependent dehydrogenase (short-subunit alcohol dehydrogenase family)